MDDIIFYHYDGRVHAIYDDFLYSLYDGIGGLLWNLGPNSSPDGPLAYLWRSLKTSRKIRHRLNDFS